MTTITLAEQIAAVERAMDAQRTHARYAVFRDAQVEGMAEADALAAALATLRGLEMVEVTR